ncbi:MAG: serine hydroxymethyltransferase [Marinifilum sp.]|jgi:glycine hydroxymethyltransferase|nr:serine hydroxymethyltransferase [Marinifilum sp.]MCT4644941.1 serine hydroxymethyltransferase [Carboxylicivirga sp.]
MFIFKRFSEERFNRINKIIDSEYALLANTINLIGSSNYPFKSVVKALGTAIFTNPAEGFKEKRYFPMCSNLDELENYADEQVKEFFNYSDAYEVSLQPHSGTQANQIVYNAVLNPNDTVLALRMDCGAHVSHSTIVKKYYNLVEYGIADELIDYDGIEKLCSIHKPKLLIAGTSSYPRQIRYDILHRICKKYSVLLLADISHTAIFIASKHHISPFEYADFITLTTNKTTRGPRGGAIVFQKKYRMKIQRAIFPITQGSPKYNDILAKTVMFVELNNMDIAAYTNKILSLSQEFAQFFMSKGIKVYTGGTDCHLVVLDLQEQGKSGVDCEKSLEEINVLVNRNSVPNDPQPPHIGSGLRFGFLTLATLNFDHSDFCVLKNIIFKQLFEAKQFSKNDIYDIISRYTLTN